MSHLNVAKNLLANYGPGEPLNFYLKTYFKQHKKHGSKDRKLIAALCYNYFRLGSALKNIPVEEKLLIGFFLCENISSDFLKSLKPEWGNAATSSLSEKVTLGNWQSEIDNIFPFKDELCKEIDAEKFSWSFLIQPRLFIRIRPGFKKSVISKLHANNVEYEMVSEDCVAFNNSSKINTFIDLDKEAVVQDYNSQRVGKLMKQAIDNHPLPINIWDCCAASGGKSIMAFDINSSVKLTVSDKRKSILKNLHQRFTKAGVKNYRSFVADLTTPSAVAQLEPKPDIIIADVPCSGSGTWGRTPEQLYYFDKKQIENYSTLQKQIVENAVHHLKRNGHLLYVTCSVFKQENEEVVDFITSKLSLILIQKEVLKGYEIQSDTLFAALFMKSPVSTA